MYKRLRLATAMMAMALICGCESDTSTDGDISSTPSSKGGDAINIGSISWLGANYSGARVNAKINSASTDGSFLYTSYDPYSWPSQTDRGVRIDAICCFFYERGGQIVGGKYDFWRAGGQGGKTLENVKHRYQGHSMPARGTRAYTMIVSLNGSERSNIHEVTWR